MPQPRHGQNESSHSALILRGFGAAFDERVVLVDIDLAIPRRGTMNVLGPGGAGKSTLLRTLAGLNDPNPSFRTWGDAFYNDAPLAMSARPVLVQQNARLLTASVRENIVAGLVDRSALSLLQQNHRVHALLDELGVSELIEQLNDPAFHLPLPLQRIVAIARAVMSTPALVMVDEATANLDTSGAAQVLGVLERVTERCALLFVTHNQQHAMRLGGHTALLAGGRIQEAAPTEVFFSAPATDPGRSFVRTGGCSVPSPNATRADLREDAPPPPPLPPVALTSVSHVRGPRGFFWLKRGMLGGAPRPGLIADVDADLEALTRVGVNMLVTLEETRTVPHERLAAHQIQGVHVPILDMSAPSLESANDLCRNVSAWTAAGRVVALHCRAGMGRTGTMLAAQLIWEGESDVNAIHRVRSINPDWIQSDEQVAFLSQFYRFLGAHGGVLRRASQMSAAKSRGAF